MSHQILEQATQTIDLFKKIIVPLKQSFDLSFGYMIIFNDGQYYTLVEDKECLENFVEHVDKGCIFYNQDIPTSFSENYYFSLWPELPNCRAMEIYYQYNQWHGITVSKLSDDYTELWWFTGCKENDKMQSFLIANKNLLLEFINYFNYFKPDLLIPTSISLAKNLFLFKHGFEIYIPLKEPIREENKILKLINYLRLKRPHNHIITASIENLQLSVREMEILDLICHGLTAKIISIKLHVSVKTIQRHIENIKRKTGLHFKTELIELYEKSIKN